MTTPRPHIPRPHARRAVAVVVAVLATVVLAGCFNPFRPIVGTTGAPPEPPPRPNSPQGVLQLFRWCWENRAIAEYEELFTDDFRFAFADVDSTDNAPIDRIEELEIARRIFVDGSAAEPRANRIELTYNSSLLSIPDSRPGKIDPWHKEIRARVVLRVELIEAGSPVSIDVQGDVTFYLTRGDSALIPDDLIQRGITNDDNTRWFIERWEDKTGGSGPESAVSGGGRLQTLGLPRSAVTLDSTTPARRMTWGELMHRYSTRVTAAR